MVSKLEDSVFGYVRIDYPEREKESSETELRFDIYLGPSLDDIKNLVAFVSGQEPGARYGEIHTFRLSAAYVLLAIGKLQRENDFLYHEITSGFNAYHFRVFERSAVRLCSTRENTFLDKSLEP